MVNKRLRKGGNMGIYKNECYMNVNINPFVIKQWQTDVEAVCRVFNILFFILVVPKFSYITVDSLWSL